MVTPGIAQLLLPFLAAMTIAMVLIPLLVRMAPKLGMIDLPDARKVHVNPIPRIGGIGIVIGALVPMFLWLPLELDVLSYLFGVIVLLVFGAWDDSRELGHYTKFIGQFAAVIAIVFVGDTYVERLPLFGYDNIDPTAGKIFTLIALVGMINAINHSDGLDGLAGGETILSLACIAYLAYAAGGDTTVIIALTTVGGVLGFLRYNSHPARVFMGDSGSQVLGLTVGFLAVRLTQIDNPALSPALPALILGLPVIDIVAVLYQRVTGGMNWFRATKNHIHHRLLALNFHHYEAVVAIYVVQALLVFAALPLSYESDALILGIYAVAVVALFGSLTLAERVGWKAHTSASKSRFGNWIARVTQHESLVDAPVAVLALVIPLYFVIGSFSAEAVSLDLGISAALLAVLLFVRLIFGYKVWFLFLRLIIYITAAFVVYLVGSSDPGKLGWLVYADAAVITLILFAAVLAMRFSSDDTFRISPLDYLVVLIVLIMSFVSEQWLQQGAALTLMMKLIIMFYGAELVLRHMRSRWCPLTLGAFVALTVIALRSLL